jgi:hypothetical protein
MNEEEKKAIEDMHRFANGIDMSCVTARHMSYVTARQMQIILNLIEKLQKENEELKERIREYTLLILPYYVKENFISVQKVKDKIEKLEEELEIMKVDNMYGRYKEYGGKTKWERLFATKYGMHDALQELIEGRK